MSGLLQRLSVGLALLVGVAALADGVMFVDSGEAVVVYRFGAIARTATSGLQLRAPWPLESDERIAIGEARRVETGERRLVTGDTNLVDLDLVVQYAVSDPVAYVLGATDPEAVVIQTVKASAAEVLSTMEVDFLMTTGRSELQSRLRERAQASLDARKIGVTLADVDVRELSPPPPVVDAFNDVSSARGDRETLALSADAYASTVIPDARGEAAQMVEVARGDASRIVSGAQGDVARFSALKAAHDASPGSVKAQLRAELWADLGEDIDVIGAAPGTEVYLPTE